MFKRKQKFHLSKNLRMGIEAPSSQGTLFKVGGVFFLLLSVLVSYNIYRNIQAEPKASLTNAGQEQVLGAFDNQPSPTPTPAPARTYKVQKGDTLFNIAQSQGVNWAVIATLNNLKAPYSLKPGMVLKLEAAQ